MALTRERAERIARATPCPRCREYTWKRVRVREGAEAVLGAVFTAELTCGVCGAFVHLGLDDDGDVLYVG